MKRNRLSINSAVGSILLSAISTTSIAGNENPFLAKPLPQGYMVLAENTLPEPPPPPDKTMSNVATNPQAQAKTLLKPQGKALSNIKASKMQDGGCGAGSCAAKLNKAKGQNAAK